MVYDRRTMCLWVAAIRWMAVRRRADGGYLFASFPSCTWERPLFPAKFHFALTVMFFHLRSAMKLPQQVRSQVQLGNEGRFPGVCFEGAGGTRFGASADDREVVPPQMPRSLLKRALPITFGARRK